MEHTARRALADQLAALIPPTAPRPAADAPAAAYRRPAWLDGRTETPRRPHWITASSDTPDQVTAYTT